MPSNNNKFNGADILFSAALLIMMAGLLFSRALLTVGIFILLFAAIISCRSQVFKNFFKDRLNVLISLLFIIPLISGVWSSDLTSWSSHTFVKLPLLILPIAFASLKPGTKIILGCSWMFILLIFTGACISTCFYFIDANAINYSYLRSGTIIVPFNNDHVLFSWAVVIAIVLILAMRQYNELFGKFTKQVRVAALIISILLILFLHLLAARTGLACLYGGAIVYFICQVRKANATGFIVLAMILIMLPVLAYNFLPTFHNRVRYAISDFQQYSRNSYPPDFSDVSRIVSYKGGLSIFRNNILTGVGYGDIDNEMIKWYKLNFDYLPKYNRLLPHNEWLMYGCGAGILAVIILTAVLLCPFLNKKYNGNAYLLCFTATSAICFMTDMTLEMQTGVFLFGFFMMWMRIVGNKQLTVDRKS